MLEPPEESKEIDVIEDFGEDLTLEPQEESKEINVIDDSIEDIHQNNEFTLDFEPEFKQ
jgi:hypothetical protein